ncbi:hypothetical protein DLJ57_07450, partial [Micromonospora chalcea]
MIKTTALLTAAMLGLSVPAVPAAAHIAHQSEARPAVAGLPLGMAAAMRRDLHLTDDQLTARLAAEAAAAVVDRRPV